MTKWIKEKWEWLVAGIILLIGIVASSKTKNKVKEKDLQARLDTEKKIAKDQEEIRINSQIKKDEILKDYEDGTTVIQKEEKERIEELSNDPDALDNYLQNLGLNKK
jgi:uncharacterized membrane-anchored protein YhcB (DUF1043 family)